MTPYIASAVAVALVNSELGIVAALEEFVADGRNLRGYLRADLVAPLSPSAIRVLNCADSSRCSARLAPTSCVNAKSLTRIFSGAASNE
jgi:hypothetical protein